jgi:hypothetical protein
MTTLGVTIDLGGLSSVIMAISVLVGALGVIVNLVLTYLSRREIKKEIIEVRKDVAEVHETTNGKMEKLLAVVTESEHAKGVLQGKTEGKALEKSEEAERKTAGNPTPNTPVPETPTDPKP